MWLILRHAALYKEFYPFDKNKETLKKKVTSSDWSQLPPEERIRREQQRARQIEVAKLRESGQLVVSSNHRHPLNSQRRRANRRKPGKIGLLAQTIKQQKLQKNHTNNNNNHNNDGSILSQFNANGYERRKQKLHGKDLQKKVEPS